MPAQTIPFASGQTVQWLGRVREWTKVNM